MSEESASPLQSSTALLAAFNAKATNGALNKPAFVALVTKLISPSISIPKPSEADLGAAFVLADADNSGSVDVFEFFRLFNLIKDGKVKGLGAKPTMFATGSGAKKSAAFKAAFLSTAELRVLFDSKAVSSTGAAPSLSKAVFVALLAELFDGAPSAPMAKDLDVAFTLADEDQSGTVDEEEFLKIFNVAKAGKVKGLGTAFQGSAASRAKLEADFKAGKLCSLALGVGDDVSWKSADEELPKGTVGQVLCVHADGDVEVLFPTAGGAQVFTFTATQLSLKPRNAAAPEPASEPAASEPAEPTPAPEPEPTPEADVPAPPAPLNEVGNPMLDSEAVVEEVAEEESASNKGFEFPQSLIFCF